MMSSTNPNNNKNTHKVAIMTSDDGSYDEEGHNNNNKSPIDKEKSDKRKQALALSKSPGSFSLNRKVKVNNNTNAIENGDKKSVPSSDSSSSDSETITRKKSVFQTLFFVINIVVIALIFGVLAIISATIFTQGLKAIDDGMRAAASELAESVALKIRDEFTFQRRAAELLFNVSKSLSPETGNPYSSETARERFVRYFQTAPLSIAANRLWPKFFCRFIDGSYILAMPYDPAINESDTANNDQDMLDANLPPTLSPSEFLRPKFHRFQLCRSYTGVYNSTVASNPNLQLDLQHDCNISIFNVTDTENITAQYMTDENSAASGVAVVRGRSAFFYNSQGYNILRRLIETAPSNATWFKNAVSQMILSTAGVREPMVGASSMYTAKYPFDAASPSLQHDAFVSWMLIGVSVKELCRLLHQMKPVDIPNSQIFLYSPRKDRVFAYSDGITYQISPLPLAGLYPNCIAATDARSMACFYNLSDYAPYQPLRQALESTTEDDTSGNSTTHGGHEHDTSTSSSVTALHSSIPIDIFFEDLILHFFLPKSHFQEAVNESLAVAAATFVTIACAVFVVVVFMVKLMIVRIEVISHELSKNPFIDWSEIEEGIQQNEDRSCNWMLRLSCDTEEVSELEEAFGEFRAAILKLRSFMPSSTLQPTAIDMIAGGVGDDEHQHSQGEDADSQNDLQHHNNNDNNDNNSGCTTDEDSEVQDKEENNNKNSGSGSSSRDYHHHHHQKSISPGSSLSYYCNMSNSISETPSSGAAVGTNERSFTLHLRENDQDGTKTSHVDAPSENLPHQLSQSSQQPLTEKAGILSPDDTAAATNINYASSSDRLNVNHNQVRKNNSIHNVKTALLRNCNTSTNSPKSSDCGSVRTTKDNHNNNNDDDGLSTLQTRQRSNTETSDTSAKSDHSSTGTAGLVSILKKKGGGDSSGNSVKIRMRRRGGFFSQSNPRLTTTTPLGNTMSLGMSQSEEETASCTQDAEEEEILKSEKYTNNSYNNNNDDDQNEDSASTVMRVQFNPVVLNVAHPNEQKNHTNNSIIVINSNSVSASMSDDRFSFTSPSHQYQQPSTLINNNNNENVSNYIASPYLLPSALQRASGSQSSDFGSNNNNNNNNNNSAVTPTLLKDGSAENDHFLSAQDKKSIKLSRNHRCLVASVHFFGPGDQDEINHRRERFHQSKKTNNKLNRGVDMTRSADSMDGGNNYSEGGPDMKRIRSFRSTGSSSSSSQHSSFATTEEKQKLVDRSAMITELMMKEVIESTGAHLIEYRNDTYGLALLLSRRQRSLLAYRFMSKLVSVSQKIAEHPLQKPYNQGSNGNVCMVVGFSVGLSKILSLFVESSASPTSSMPPPSSAPAAADNSHHPHSSIYDNHNNNDDSDTSTHPSRPVTIVTDCISFANKIERSLRFKMIDDKLKASVLAKRKRISELHDQQQQQQKLNNDNSDDDNDDEEEKAAPPAAVLSNNSSSNINDDTINQSTNNSPNDLLPHQPTDDNNILSESSKNSSGTSALSPQDRVIEPATALPPSPSPLNASVSTTSENSKNNKDNNIQRAVVSVGDRRRVSSLVNNNLVQKNNRNSNNNINNNVAINKTHDERKIAASLTHCIGYMFSEVGQLIPYMVSQEYPFMKFAHTWNCYTKKTVAKNNNNSDNQQPPETEMILSFLKGAISVNRVLGFAEAAAPAGARNNNTNTGATTANELPNNDSSVA